MNRRIEELKRRVRDGKRQVLRKKEPINILPECEADNLSWMKRVARLTIRQCEAETVVIEPEERYTSSARSIMSLPIGVRHLQWGC
jgi:hypothetical protein